MLRLLALAVLAVVLIGTAVLAFGYLSFGGQISADVERLRSGARPPSASPVTAARLAALPPAAQRYFAHAGVVAGTAIPRLVTLHQKGRIRSSLEADWMTLEAEEAYSTSPPAFVWRAWFPTPMMPIALGRDEYLDGEGSILMKLLALVPVADEHGDELRAAGLMRFLNEMTWFPAAFLGDNVTITAVDDTSFGVALTDRGLTAQATMIVDADGRLLNFRATRFNTGTRTMETWETPMTAEASFEGLTLPSVGSAVWKLAAGDLDYIELTVTDIRYDD